MKKNLLIALFALCAYSLYADGQVVTLDSIMTRDVYNDLWKSEKYTYDEKQQVVKYIKWDNTGSSLKQDSTRVLQGISDGKVLLGKRMNIMRMGNFIRKKIGAIFNRMPIPKGNGMLVVDIHILIMIMGVFILS